MQYSNVVSARVAMVCVVALMVGLAGCGGGGSNGTGTTGAETTAAGTTNGVDTTGGGAPTDETTTDGTTNETTTGTSNGNQDADMLFGGRTVSIQNGSIMNESTFLGNATILESNQDGDNLTDVRLSKNGTAINQEGEIVGEVQVYELCPTVSGDGEFYFGGDAVNVSAGAVGNVYQEGQQDTYVDLNVTANNETGLEPGLTNVRLATNGSIINETGAVVGQFEINPRCPSVGGATSEN